MSTHPMRGVFRLLLASLVASSGLLAQSPTITGTKTDSFTPNGAGKVLPGAPIQYTTTITNSGSGAATGVDLADAVPANTTLVPGSVNVSPLAVDDAYTTMVNTQLAAGSPTVLSGVVITSAAKATDNDREFLSDTFTISAFDATSVNGGSIVMVTSGPNMGSFTFVPAAGFVGTDSFTYTLRDDGTDGIAGNADDLTGVGTVVINVTEANTGLAGTQKVWYIDSSYAGANGTENGTSARPFNALSDVSGSTGPDAATDTLYLRTGSGNYTGGIVLLADQSLIGQNEALVLNGNALALAGADPVIVNSGGVGVTLATGNTLRGFTLGDTTADDISGTAVGSLTISNVICSGTGGILRVGTSGALAVTIDSATTTSATNAVFLTGATGTCSITTGAISGVSGDDFSISGGTATISYGGTISNSAGRSVNVSGKSGGTVTFSGAISDTAGSTGISLTNNAGATINFTGGLNVSTGASAAFTATGGGTVSVTGATNTLTTTTGTALNVANTTIGASGLTFRSISVNGGSSGIIVSNTGSNAGLTVSGTDGSDSDTLPDTGTGGTLLNITGDAVSLSNTSFISLGGMNITDAGANSDPVDGSRNGSNWIDASSVNGLTLLNVNANGSVGHGVLASSLSNLVIQGGAFISGGGDNNEANYNGFDITNLLGTSTISAVTFQNANTINFRVNNTSATNFGGTADTLTINNTIWRHPTPPPGGPFTGDHLSVNADTGANFRLVVNNTGGGNTFTGGGTAVQATSGGTNGKMDADISGVTSGGSIASGNANTALAVIGCSGGGSTTYDVHDNISLGTGSLAIAVTHASANGVTTGKIRNNNITHIAGPSTNALQVIVEGSSVTSTGGTGTVSITGNTITGNFQRAIQVQPRIATATLNATVQNNIITGTDTTGVGLQIVNAEAGGSGSGHVCTLRLNMSGNSATIPGGATYLAHYRLVHRAGCTYQLQNLAQASTTNIADVQAWVTTTKSNIATGTATGTSITVTGAANTFTTTAGVPLPLLFAESLPPLPEAGMSAPTTVSTVDPPSAPQPEAAVQTAPKPVPAETILTNEHLQKLIAEAKSRWIASGLTPEQKAAIEALRFEISDLNELHLGQAAGDLIQISRTAAGNAWFVDETPSDDCEFDGLRDQASGLQSVDLLTTLMHEMGHRLGLPDSYDLRDRSSIMYGYLTRGERRLPAPNQARGAGLSRDEAQRFLGATINIGTLPAGKSVTIVGTVLVNDPANTQLISSQGNITGTNFAALVTDDPAAPGSTDPTTTPVERPDASVVSIATGTTPTNTGSVSWTVTFDNAVSNVVAANFALANIGLTAPSITGVTAVGPQPASVWTVTASTGTGDGTLGLNMANDTGSLSHDILNKPFTGGIYSIDRTAPVFTSITRQTPSGQNTNADTLVFRATFSEAVTGVDATDFTVSGTTAAITGVSGTGPYDLTLSGGDLAGLNGTVSLALAGAQNITDTAGNPLPGTAPATNQSYTVDNTAPTVTLTSATGNPAANAVIPVTVTFSESVTGFDLADISVSGGSKGNFAGTGSTYTFDLTPSGPGVTVTADITADAAQDIAANGNTAATQFVRNIVDAVSIAATTSTAVEGGTTGLYTFTRGASTGDLTVSFQLDPSSTATAGTDFTLTSSATLSFDTGTGAGTIVIPNGQLAATVTLTALAETPNPAEAGETARLNVLAGSGYVAGSPANATVTITENSFLVTTTNDSGTGSLRQAVLNANAIAGTDTITFSDGTGGSVNFTDASSDTITLTSGNLPISQPVTISGTGAKKLSVSGGGSVQIFNVTNSSGTVVIRGLRLTNGYAVGGNPGGALRMSGAGTVAVLECELSGNTSSGSIGGAIYNTGNLVVANSSLHGNVAGQGAAIYSQTTQAAELTNVTVSGNNTAAGAIYANGGTLRLSSVTITSNLVGIRVFNNPVVALRNSIIAGNSTDISYASTASPITSEGYNLIGNTTGVTIDGTTTGNLTGTSASPLNPQLAALADNGGSNQTHALLAGSPALNAGSNALLPTDTFDLDGDTNVAEPLPFDQRGAGFARAIGTVDIGAFELQKSVSIGNLAAISEGNSGTTNFVFTITRTGDTTGDVNMTYTVSGAAVNGTDFVGGSLPTGTATITNGNATTTVTIPVSGDTTVEPNEAFTVTLTSPDNGYVVSGAPATSTINNDDTATVGIAKITDGAEANTPTNGKFRVTQTAASSTDTTVAYTVTGTATSGTDFTALSGSVTIPAGQTTADIDVTILNDGSTLEPTETVILTLNSVTSTNAVTLGTPTSATMDLTDDDTATVSIAKITDGAETGPTSAVFRVTQSAPATVDTIITYTTGGTAGVTDFTAPSGSVTITAGNTTADISVAITNDAIVEATETLSLTLTGFTARDADVSLGTTVLATADITDNDTATVTIAKINDGGEPATNGLFRVTQTAASSTDTTVTYAVTGTATSGSDFTALSGSVTIPAGQTTADVAVTVTNDAIVEATETVIATLNGFSTRDADISLGATLSATVNITDEDTATVTLAKITDGVEAASPTNAVFRVTQTAVSSADTTVTYTIGGTATSGTDFTALSGSVTILAGNTTADITVAVLNENIVEGTETVSLTLTGFTTRDPDVTLGATLTASANITDSDTATVTLAKITDGAESGTSALFRVTQTAPASVDTVVTYTTGGSASSGSDYSAPSGSVTILAGNTTADISITITDDSLVEPTETLSLTLNGFTARDPDVSLGSTVLATADITDNDNAIVSVTKVTDGAESNTPTAGSFRISQSALSSVDTVVNLSITGSATSGSDFTALPASVTIPANQNGVDVSVVVLNDNIIESTETVTMTLSSLGAHNTGVSIASGAAPSLPPGVEAATTIFSNTATLSITDNDVAASIAVSGGSGQTATVNTAFASPLVAIVKDVGGVALQGASVTFTANGMTASGSFTGSATVVSNSLGLATAPTFTANTLAGNYVVLAATAGVSPSASFSLTNAAGAATQLRVTAPPSAIAGVPVDVNVAALDAFGNLATSYPGTARITSSDSAAVLPSNSTLVSGTKTFSVNFSTGGNQTVTATDTASSSITGTSGLVAVSPRADLDVKITDSPDPASALGNLTYTVTLTNNGPSASASPSVSLPLPAFTTFVSASGTAGWTPTTPTVGTNGTVSFSNTTLASAASATFTIVAKVDLNVVNGSTLTATATSSETTVDPVNENNSATATTLARSGADLVATLTATPEPVVAGTELTYTLQLQNNGPLDADNAVLSFPLPAGTSFVSLGGNSGWNATTPAVGGTGTVSITNSLFAPGTVSFPLVVKVGSDVATGSVLNATLTSSSTTIDVAPGNESANAAANVITRADLDLDLAGTPTTAPKGSDVNYTLTLLNKGPSDAVNPSVTFPSPAQMTFVSASAPLGWNVSTPAIGAGGTVTFTRAGLVNAASVSFTVVTKVKTTAANGTVIEATASASATGTDPVTPNNSDLTTAAVGTTTPTSLQIGTTGTLNRQNGLFELTVNVTNTTPLPINGFRLHVNYASYLAAYPSLRLYNASSPAGSSDVYVDYPYPVAVDSTIPLRLSFYTSTRTFPNPFAPVLSVEILPTSAVAGTDGSGVQPRLVILPDHDVMLQWDSVPGHWYRIRYSHDLVHWFESPVPIQAANNRMQWIDNGAPFTSSPPSSVPSRYYRVNEINVAAP